MVLVGLSLDIETYFIAAQCIILLILFNLNIEQFFSIIIVHLLAVISPGPDFTIVLKVSKSESSI